MKARFLLPTILAGLILLLALPVVAGQSSTTTLYYYRDGQAVPVTRRTVLAGEPQTDATALLAALVDGPTPDEQASGLVSALPPGTELIGAATEGSEVTVDLRIPLDFLRADLDAYLSDAIVEQVVKTLHPLDLHHIHVRTENEEGRLVPVSDFLPRPTVPPPTIPPNDDATPPESVTSPRGPDNAPQYVGQPPASSQGQPQGALSGKTVWLSAGHGWYWSDLLSRWNTQRPNTYGIVEDFANAEAVNYYLARYLWNAGADVWLVRERSMNEHEVIVDNDDGAPGYTETGSWYFSSYSGYEDGSYHYAISSGEQTSTATWTPNLPQAGWYAVWAWYRHGANRPSDARYEIHHAGGVTTVSTSQQIHGQTWRYLGEYFFEAGTAGHVTLGDESEDPGAAVVADAIRFGGGLGSIAAPGGTSGQPRWEEESSLWAQYQGAPSSVYANDVTARPLYAEWETAKGYPGEAENAVYVSWHTNAGGGSGTNSYIHDTGLPTGSAELQDWVHAELVGDLKAAWNPAWKDRGQKSANFGELRELTNIPGVLLEVAFHDTEDPGDADDLKEPVFRQIAARAVFQGIVKYFADDDGALVHLSPEPPTRLAVRNTGPGQVTLSWAAPPCCDGIVGDAATSFKVYHGISGRAFDNGTETTGTSLVLSGLTPGSLHFFRVTALNQGGESFPTPVVAVRTPLGGSSPSMLIIDGFDRLDQAALIPQWESPALGTAKRMFLERMNRYDYAVEHARALSACGLAFDGALDEAVTAGLVDLTTYAAVDWIGGEESGSDAALSAEARTLLAAYLDGGGRLLISGSEIGYDLVEGVRDPAFFDDYLKASYGGDDADTYSFAGTSDGPFAGLAGSFDDSTGGTYDVDRPDRLAASSGSEVVLSYAGGSGDGAAIAYDGDFQLVYFGFPLETVIGPATRTGLFCAAADYLLPFLAAGVSLSPNHDGAAEPGQTAVYTHTLANTGSGLDTFHISHASNQGWIVDHPAAISVDSGGTATLVVSITVPLDAVAGTTDTTLVTATSQTDLSVFDTITNSTAVSISPICTPRLINPGFEAGLAQSAWQATAGSSDSIFAPRQDLPTYVQPHSGDWLASLNPEGVSTPAAAASLSITQVVALPAGEPTATLTLAWFVHASAISPIVTDTLSVTIYDLSGTLLTEIMAATNHSPSGTWQVDAIDLSAFAGQTVQLALRATTSDTTFFLDDVNLTTCGLPGPHEFRALWVDAFHDGAKTPRQIDELIKTAQAGNFNALIVQVRRRGDTYYPSALDPWAPDADTGFDALAYLVEQAHAAGIEVHAWATTLAIWSDDAPPAAPDHTFNLHGPGNTGRDYWLMTSYRDEDKPGDKVYYLDPGHPDVVDYVVAIYAELVAKYDLDGLHLDRIRYPESQGEYCQGQEWHCQDWGYNPASVARFQAHTGRTDLPDPLDEAWIQWRRDQVTALVRRIYLTVTALDPWLRVSAAVSAVGYAPNEASGWQTRSPYRQQLQDWRGWLEEGILDLALPMVYRNEDSGTSEFDDWIAWAKDHQYGRGTVIGTSLYLNPGEDGIAQWVRARQPSPLGYSALGLSGYSYASPADEPTSRRAFVNSVVTQVFTQPATTPFLFWKDVPTLGHLMGALTGTLTCHPPVDGQILTLTGLQTRSMIADGSGWFGAVDLPPGDYLLTTDVQEPEVTTNSLLRVTVGAVTEQDVVLPDCASEECRTYLPMVTRQFRP